MASTDTSSHLQSAHRHSEIKVPVNGKSKSGVRVPDRLVSNQTFTDRATGLMEVAQEVFAGTGSWVVFYREMLGVDGAVRKWFPKPDEYSKFQKSSQYAELQEMVAALRSQDGSKADTSEPERMITIRIPQSLHDALTKESEEALLSVNKLCISKLLQRVEDRFVPIQQGQRRGRRPGPQGPRKKS